MIIGHRGAGKLAPENSLEGFKKAKQLGLLCVEFDIQLTKDKKFVLHHDGHFTHNDKKIEISQHTQKDLSKMGLPTLEQALRANKDCISMIDIKVWDSSQYLLPQLKGKNQVIRFTGSNLPDIKYCKQNAPDIFAYISENKNPFRAVRRADRIIADGISLKWFLVNPITYRQCKRRGLEIALYTVNIRLLGKYLSWLYPQISLCTDRPERFIGKRYNW